jgi:hypothetical protein
MQTILPTSLSAAQRLVLDAAAQRPDRMVVPRPPGLRARGAVRQRLLTPLLNQGLVEELPTKDEDLAWRRDEQGQHHLLRLTSAGLAAITGASAGSDGKAAGPAVHRPAVVRPSPAAAGQVALGRGAEPEDNATAPAAPPPRPSGKLGQVLDALGKSGGATLTELVGLTGWQPHTTRAALTRLRRRGYGLRLDAMAGRRAYHLAPARQG